MRRWGLCLLLTGCAWVTDEELAEAGEDCGCSDEGVVVHPDLDGDGFGDPAGATTCPDSEGSWVNDASDCDDQDAAVHPGAQELCNGLDDDCDGSTDGDDAADPSPWYLDADGDGWGDADTWLSACDAPSGYVSAEQTGDCDDDEASANPDESEVCGDGLDNDCDGGPGDCRATGELELDGAWLLIESDEVEDGTGLAMAASPDLNGDGQPDLLLGAARRSSGASGGGEVLLFSGPFDGGTLELDDADVRLQGYSDQLHAGSALAALGDQAGDGSAWIAVGCSEWGVAASSAGVVHLLEQPLAGTMDLESSAAVSLEGEAEGDLLGSVLVGGDLDGDGRTDLALAAPGADSDTGSVWLLQAPISSFGGLGQAHARLDGEEAGGAMGSSLAVLGDVDGDGQADLLLGAPEAGGQGAAYLFLGPVSGSLGSGDADRRYGGEEDQDELGTVAHAKDTDNDGYHDFLLGAPGDDGGGVDRGSAWLVTGASYVPASLAAADAQITGDNSGGRLGTALLGPGDFDADGYGDLLVGGPGTDPESRTNAGTAWLLYGPVSGSMSASQADLWMLGTQSDANAGTALASPGDLDADGFADLMLGAPGDGVPGVVAIFTGTGW